MSKQKGILVGVDGSPPSRVALEWAGDEAVRRGSELEVVMAWHAAAPASGGPASTLPTHGLTDHAEAATEVLMTTIKEVLGDEPPVLVRPQVKEGNAAKLLIDLSADADLLVVGTRGLGGFAGLLLGSVSQHVAAHASCPVVVVR